MSDNLFFDGLLGLFMGAYFEFLISGIFSYQFGRWSSMGEKLSLSIGIFNLVITCGFIPYSVVVIFFLPHSILKNSVFFRRYGQLYQGTRFKYQSVRLYPIIFVARRLIFIWVAMQIPLPFTIQMIIMMNLNVMCLIYEGLIKPGDRFYINRLELMNEWFVNIITFSLLFFTDWIPDV